MITKELLQKRIATLQAEIGQWNEKIAQLDREREDAIAQVNVRMGAAKELGDWIPQAES